MLNISLGAIFFHIINSVSFCTSINAVPYQITAPGKYCVRKNLSYKDSSSNAILIASDNVSVDFKGHELKGIWDAKTRAVGIESYGHNNIVIKNGTIKNFMYGVRIQEPDLQKFKNSDPHAVHDITISNVKFEYNTFRGLSIFAKNTVVKNSKFYSTGGTTAHRNAFSMAVEIMGPSCDVSNNIIRDVNAVGVGEAVGISISAFGDACKIHGNSVVNNFLPGIGRSFGLWIGFVAKNPIVISDNTISGFSYAGNILRSPQITLSNNQLSKNDCDNFYGVGPEYYRGKKFCYEEDPKVDLVRAEEGDPNYLFKLGMEYLDGLWVKRDVEKGIYYLSLSAQKGCAEAKRQIQMQLAEKAAASKNSNPK